MGKPASRAAIMQASAGRRRPSRRRSRCAARAFPVRAASGSRESVLDRRRGSHARARACSRLSERGRVRPLTISVRDRDENLSSRCESRRRAGRGSHSPAGPAAPKSIRRPYIADLKALPLRAVSRPNAEGVVPVAAHGLDRRLTRPAAVDGVEAGDNLRPPDRLLSCARRSHAAGHAECLASDEAGIRRCEEQDGGCYFLRCSEVDAARSHPASHSAIFAAMRDRISQHGRVHRAGRHDIRGDVVSRIFPRNGFREADDACLGGGID